MNPCLRPPYQFYIFQLRRSTFNLTRRIFTQTTKNTLLEPDETTFPESLPTAILLVPVVKLGRHKSPTPTVPLTLVAKTATSAPIRILIPPPR